MSLKSKRRKDSETLAWITDDEAEFWTTVPRKDKRTLSSNPNPTANESSSDVILSDGLYFKSNNSINPEVEDHLSSIYKEEIEKQAKDVVEDAEKKQTSEIFELNETNQVNENIPGISMSFLDRLYHQLTRPRASMYADPSDEEFTEIDQDEITSVTNDSADQALVNGGNQSKEHGSLKTTLRSFIEELTEEKDVIWGSMDHDSLCNRRSRKAKSSQPVFGHQQVLVNRTSL